MAMALQFFNIWDLSRRDQIIISWWGGQFLEGWHNFLVVVGANKIFSFLFQLSQPSPSTTRKLFCLFVTCHDMTNNFLVVVVRGWGHFLFVWDDRNFRTISRILIFQRAKLLKTEFLVERDYRGLSSVTETSQFV